MTHTDKAFIKAYRTGNTASHSATTAPTGPSVPAPAGVAVDSMPQMAYVDASALIATALNEMVDTTYVGMESIGASALPNLATVKKTPAESRAVEPPQPKQVIAQPTKKIAVGSPRMPLSSFTSEAMEANDSQVKFTWPDACDQVVQSTGEQWNSLVKLVSKQADAGQSILAFAGIQKQLGCTTTVLSMARELANLGKRVVIVDANTSNPTVAEQLALRPTSVWQDVLENGVSVGEALIHSQAEHVSVMPLEKVLAGAGQLFECLQTSVTAGVLRYEFDVVLVDFGALESTERLEVATSLARAMRIDHAIVLGNPNHSETDQQIERIGLTLETVDCQVLGVIQSGG